VSAQPSSSAAHVAAEPVNAHGAMSAHAAERVQVGARTMRKYRRSGCQRPAGPQLQYARAAIIGPRHGGQVILGYPLSRITIWPVRPPNRPSPSQVREKSRKTIDAVRRHVAGGRNILPAGLCQAAQVAKPADASYSQRHRADLLAGKLAPGMRADAGQGR